MKFTTAEQKRVQPGRTSAEMKTFQEVVGFKIISSIFFKKKREIACFLISTFNRQILAGDLSIRFKTNPGLES